MASNNNYFLISGFISFSLFALILFSFILMMFQPSKINSYALKKDNYISISLVTPKVQTSQPKRQEKMNQVQISTPVESENIDIDDLFSDVWTKKIVQTKKRVVPDNTKRILDIQKKIKTTQDNDVKSISQKVNNLDNVKTNKESEASSTAQEVNEYLAKIQAIVYQYFKVPHNSQGNSVKTVIELNAFGKVLDFRVLTYSANEALNSEADKIKDRLKHVIFPKNPQKQSSRTVVILISKE